jgi:hypothetical protein
MNKALSSFIIKLALIGLLNYPSDTLQNKQCLALKTWYTERYTWLSPSLTQVLFLFFVFGGAGAWTQVLHIEPLHQPYFVIFFFFSK